jgi:CRP-like cAMP-binding protein
MAPLHKKYNPGVYLFRENDRSRELYIVETGRVRIFRTCGIREIELAVLGPGAVLGEMALIDGKPRSASAVALEHCSAAIIDADTFESKTRNAPAWFLAIIRMICEKIRKANKRLNNTIKEKTGISIALGLLRFFERWGLEENNVCSIDFSQGCNRLARLLSLSTDHVISACKSLHNGKLISLQDNRIICPDMNAMRNFCFFLRHYIRKAFHDVPPLPKGLQAFLIATVDHAPAIMETQSTDLELRYSDIITRLHRQPTADERDTLFEMLEKHSLCRIVRSEKPETSGDSSGNVLLYIHTDHWRHFTQFARYSGLIPTL